MLALGTLGLFIFAMVDPAGFGARMVGLSLVPDPLWWLLGAVVSFYFGARELHYMRAPHVTRRSGRILGRGRAERPPARDPIADNPALSAWRADEDQPRPNADFEAVPRSQ